MQMRRRRRHRAAIVVRRCVRLSVCSPGNGGSLTRTHTATSLRQRQESGCLIGVKTTLSAFPAVRASVGQRSVSPLREVRSRGPGVRPGGLPQRRAITQAPQLRIDPHAPRQLVVRGAYGSAITSTPTPRGFVTSVGYLPILLASMACATGRTSNGGSWRFVGPSCIHAHHA